MTQKAWKNSGLNGIRTYDRCDTGAVFLPTELSSSPSTGILLTHKITSSQLAWEIKASKSSGLNGILTHDRCDTGAVLLPT